VDVYETALRMIERYGFGLVLATAILWFVRTDLVLPMVDAHRSFLKEMAATQRDISQAIQEQTRLLYAIQPKSAASGMPDTEGAN
jgi:hypothetical protein